MTTSIRPLLTEMIESFLENEFEVVETLTLEEAINTFNDLPTSWKKTAANMYGAEKGAGGKDSKVEVIAATRKIKSANNIISTMRKALRRDGAALV